MGFAWGGRSLRCRAELHPDLAAVFDKALALSPFDLGITEGYRNRERQNNDYAKGRTAPGPIVTYKRWPEGAHNSYPSRAGHLDPVPVNYENWKLYYTLAGVVFAAAKGLGVRVRWGGDWDRDFDLTDQTFNDLAHWEVVDLPEHS